MVLQEPPLREDSSGRTFTNPLNLKAQHNVLGGENIFRYRTRFEIIAYPVDGKDSQDAFLSDPDLKLQKLTNCSTIPLQPLLLDW